MVQRAVWVCAGMWATLCIAGCSDPLSGSQNIFTAAESGDMAFIRSVMTGPPKRD